MTERLYLRVDECHQNHNFKVNGMSVRKHFAMDAGLVLMLKFVQINNLIINNKINKSCMYKVP